MDQFPTLPCSSARKTSSLRRLSCSLVLTVKARRSSSEVWSSSSSLQKQSINQIITMLGVLACVLKHNLHVYRFTQLYVFSNSYQMSPVYKSILSTLKYFNKCLGCDNFLFVCFTFTHKKLSEIIHVPDKSGLGIFRFWLVKGQ